MSHFLPLAFLIVAFLASLCYYYYNLLFPRTAAGKPLPPGPCPLPVIGNLHMLTPLPHRGLWALSRRYGPIMSLRLGTVGAVVASTPETGALFLRRYDSATASRPRVQASEHFSYGSKGMAFSEYGPYWRGARRVCVEHLLGASRVADFATARGEEVAALVARLRRDEEVVVDVGLKVGEVVGDIACRMILGVSFEDRNYMKEIVHQILELVGAFNIGDYVSLLAPFDLQGYTKRMKKLSKATDSVLEKIIMAHELEASSKQKAYHHKDFVDVLLSLLNKPMNPQDNHVYILERPNIKAILLDMVVASFDTSATAIEWTMSELLRSPRVMKKLQEELQTVVGLDRMVEEKDLGKLEYLDIVVKESFRLHPVAPLLVPRESTEDITIEGYFIPKKTRIIINTWAIGRDQDVWSKNANEFYPERFIGSNIDLRGHDFQLLPFGSGRRGCPGMNVGLLNVQLIIAQLVHCFNWKLPSGVNVEDIDMTEKFGLSVGRAYPLLASHRYRLHI